MQIKRGQTRVAAFLNSRREETATVGERQQITDLCTIPAARRNPLGQHAVEDQTARGRQQARAAIALLGKTPLLGEMARLVNIAAIEAEALRTEIVGNAPLANLLQACVQLLGVARQSGQSQTESVCRVGAALQLAA